MRHHEAAPIARQRPHGERAIGDFPGFLPGVRIAQYVIRVGRGGRELARGRTTSQALLPQRPLSRRRKATSATAIWPIVDSLRASR